MIMYDHSPNKHHQMIILSKWLHFILNAQLVFCERRGGKRRTPTNGIEYDNSTQQWRGSDKYSHLSPAIMYHLHTWFDFKDFKYYPLVQALMFSYV